MLLWPSLKANRGSSSNCHHISSVITHSYMRTAGLIKCWFKKRIWEIECGVICKRSVFCQGSNACIYNIYVVVTGSCTICVKESLVHWIGYLTLLHSSKQALAQKANIMTFINLSNVKDTLHNALNSNPEHFSLNHLAGIHYKEVNGTVQPIRVE